MDYYEELGLKPNATEEEIRRAHRRLVKLLHPDQQTDEGMKMLAETQMRRLNSIVEVLSDPEKRRVYDEHLRGDLGPFGPGALAVRTAAKRRAAASVPWWIASTVGAIALTVGAVWFWADNWGSSFGNRTPTYIPSEASASTGPQTSAAPPATASPAPNPPASVEVERHRSESARDRGSSAPAAPSRTIAVVPMPAATNPHANRATTPADTASTSPAKSPRKVLVLANRNVAVPMQPVNLNIAPPPNVQTASAAHLDPGALPVPTVPAVSARPPESAPPPAAPKPAPMVASAAPLPTKAAPLPFKPAPHSPLEGEWVYVPAASDKRKPGFFPPEFINLHLFWNEGGLHGQYRAKYDVANQPIESDVNFTLLPDGTNKFKWQAPNGSRGTFKVSSVDSSSIRVEWKTTVYSRGLALTAGTATLVRRQ